MARILIIEDRGPLRRLYETVLARLGHEVSAAGTGEAGVEAAPRFRPDLVIMDLVLPGISGAEAARRLRDAGVLPAAPLIITTALGDDQARAVALSAGASALLVKPFDINTLLAAVRNALAAAGHTTSSPGA